MIAEINAQRYAESGILSVCCCDCDAWSLSQEQYRSRSYPPSNEEPPVFSAEESIDLRRSYSQQTRASLFLGVLCHHKLHLDSSAWSHHSEVQQTNQPSCCLSRQVGVLASLQHCACPSILSSWWFTLVSITQSIDLVLDSIPGSEVGRSHIWCLCL